MNNTFFLLFFCLLGLPLSAQRIDSFPSDPNTFLPRFEAFMLAVELKELEKEMEEFKSAFVGGSFSDSERVTIIKVCNLMRADRMTAIPYFRLYLQALSCLRKMDPEQKHFENWHAILQGFLADSERSKLEYKRFLNYSITFFTTYNLRSSAGGTNWTTSSRDFAFLYEDKIPYLFFESTDLYAYRKEDTMRIQASTGRYDILAEKWWGKSGRVEWEGLGMPGDVYVTFGAYELDLNKSFYELDSVYFHHEAYFGNRKVLGRFTDKITNVSENRSPSYPRFESLEGNLTIREFGEGVWYSGGFSLHGNTIYGTSVDGQRASIQIRNDQQKTVFKATSNRFSIQESQELRAQDVQAVFYHEEDSISHPSVNMYYHIPSGDIELKRGESGSDRNPFFSSAHGVNIHSEYLLTNINSDTVQIGKKLARFLNKEAVSFESKNFFDRREYEKMQGLSSVNPLVMLMRVYKSNGENRFVPLRALTGVYGSSMSKESIITLLYSLSKKGFVSYNAETEMVEIKDKVRHFAESYFGQRDYDRISIISDTISENAFLNLKNNSITIQGVSKLELSPFRRVGLLPDSNKLVLHPNMDMDFNGQLFAGYTDFSGKDFHFDYPSFSVQMDSLKKMRFFPPAKDPVLFPNTPAYALTSTIENTRGRLLIDQPDNKSGKDSIALYPAFSTDAPAYVYYDDRTYVKDTSYIRDSFYFELGAFDFKNLGNYRRENLRFAGTMVSADIFPPFAETIYVRDDYSFGFEHSVPEEGYPTYGNIGRYYGQLDLSNKGFLGDGTLDYLGASIRSEDLVFRPKRVTGSANAFDLPESRNVEVETPLVHADEVTFDWLPYRDSLYISSEKFDLFNNDGFQFRGTITLTPGGVKGAGSLYWEKAEFGSDLLSFGANSVSGDSMRVSIRSLGSQESIAFLGDDLRGEINFDEGIADLTGNDSAYVSLPGNNFISSMNTFQWDLNKNEVKLSKGDRSLGQFISLVTGQDSFQFRGRSARTDLSSNNLIVDQVPYINTADALVYPDSNQAIILPGGQLATLENAVILVDSTSKRHKITEASVNILGKNSFKASGNYEYNVGTKQQSIEFSEIIGERFGKGPINKRPTVTRATGSVAVQDSFLIDYLTLFQGEISLFSQEKDLHFKGFAQLNAPKLPKKSWFAIDCDADKSNLVIPFNYPRDLEGYKVFTGFYLSRDMPVVYPCVMSPPYTLQDRKIFDVSGVFKYDKRKDQFIFGDSAKVVGSALVGNKLVFNNQTGELKGEGLMGLCDQLEYTSLDAVGTASTRFLDIPDSLRAESPPAAFEMEVMTGVNFMLPERLFRFIEAEVERNKLTTTLIPYLADQEKYKKQFSTLFGGQPGLSEVLAGVERGAVTFPDEMNDYTILLADLEMKWDRDYQSFVSTSPQIGLVSINGTPINKRIEGYVEYKMPGVGGDRFYYYLKFPSQIFYYFGFRQGVLEVYSNDSQFMDAAAKMKSNELVTKMPDGNTYEILIQTASRANMFIRRIKAVN